MCLTVCGGASCLQKLMVPAQGRISRPLMCMPETTEGLPCPIPIPLTVGSCGSWELQSSMEGCVGKPQQTGPFHTSPTETLHSLSKTLFPPLPPGWICWVPAPQAMTLIGNSSPKPFPCIYRAYWIFSLKLTIQLSRAWSFCPGISALLHTPNL